MCVCVCVYVCVCVCVCVCERERERERESWRRGKERRDRDDKDIYGYFSDLALLYHDQPTYNTVNVFVCSPCYIIKYNR